MDDNCEKIREQLPELINSGLSPEKAVELEQHRSQCPACNAYLQALAADDKLLSEFARAMQPKITRLENVAMDEIGRRSPHRTNETVAVGRRLLNSRIAQIAAGAVIVAAILIGAAMLSDSDESLTEVVELPDESPAVQMRPPAEDTPDAEKAAEDEIQELQRMFAASDVAGVTAMLNSGQPQSRIAAANYLATIGDARAIGVLEQLAAEWQGDAADNPYSAAVVQIMSRLERKSESGESEKDEAVAETTTIKPEQEVGCEGVVVDEQDQAIGEARVLLYHNRSRWGLGNHVIEETVTAADGSFSCKNHIEFSALKEHSYAQDTYILMAAHPDFAFGWRNIAQGSEQNAYRIVLTGPTSRIVSVTDDEGNPLPGVRVWPYSAGDRESSNPVLRDYLLLPTDVGLGGAVTDANGVAILTNLPDTACSFHATLEGYAQGLAFSGQTTIRLTRGAGVSGWVLAEDRKPVAGATVRFATNWMNNYFLAVTDHNGYFRFKDLPAKGWDQSPWGKAEGASGSYTITLEHEQCAAPEVNLTLEPDQSIDDFIIDAYRETTLVECRVVEFGTDLPVAGARIQGANRIGRINGYSDSEGVFAARVLPGRVSLRFLSPPDGVYVLDDEGPAESLLNFNATGRKMVVTLKTPPIAGFLRSVSGIVLGPDGLTWSQGKTVVYAAAGNFHTSTAGSYIRPVGIDSDGHFELQEVPAGRKLHVYVATEDHSLAATDVFDIPDDPGWSEYLVVDLRPTRSAAAVISDQDGNVVPDRQFSISPLVEGERIWTAERKGRTNENGLLELDGILPGLEYHLSSDELDGRTNPSLEATNRKLDLKMVLAPVEPQ